MRYGPTTALILSNDRVWLDEDLPELDLYRGDVGVVRTAWLYPNRAYEVEFSAAGHGGRRVLLLHEQMSPQCTVSAVQRSGVKHACKVAARRCSGRIGETVRADAADLEAVDVSTTSGLPLAWRESLLLA